MRCAPVDATPTLVGLLGATKTTDPNSPLFDLLDIIAANTKRGTGDDVDSKGRLGSTVENYLYWVLVIENPNLDLQFPTTEQQWYETGEWEELAVALYQKLRGVKGIA